MSGTIRGQDARSVLQEKLDFLLAEEAKTASAGQRFELRKQIEECRARLADLGAADAPPTPKVRHWKLLFVLALVAAVCVALAVVTLPHLLGKGPEPSPFILWEVTEDQGVLKSTAHPVRMKDIIARRAPGQLVAFVRGATAPVATVDDTRIFRLRDGGEITPAQGDPLLGGNSAVLVVRQALVARFPSAEVAFVFFRSQLPVD